jgi:hypothetical protein
MGNIPGLLVDELIAIIAAHSYQRVLEQGEESSGDIVNVLVGSGGLNAGEAFLAGKGGATAGYTGLVLSDEDSFNRGRYNGHLVTSFH